MRNFFHPIVAASLLLLCASAVSPALGQSESRQWSDKTGKFQISAELIERDPLQIKLLKSDGRVVTVPINVLSKADVDYLKGLDAEADNPFAGGEAMTKPDSGRKLSEAPAGSFPIRSTTEELPTDGTAIYINIDETMPAIQPDAGSMSMEFAEFARPIEELDAYARVSQPNLIDPQGPIFAVSSHRNGNAVSPANFGHIFLCSKTDKQSRLVFESDETFLLLHHNIAYDRSLAMIGVESPSDRGGDLAVMTGLSTGKPTVIARWHLPEWQKPGFKPKAEMGVMLDGSRALVQVNSSIYCWSLDEGKCHFRIDQVPATGKVAVSAGGRYLAIAVGGGTQIIDVSKSELLGKIPFSGLLTPEIRFAPDGVRLAMTAGNQVAVWNLLSAGLEMEETIDSPVGRLVGWVGNDSILGQFALIDLELGQPVWKYNLPSGGSEMTVPGGYVCVDKNIRPALIQSLPLPHPSIQKVKQKLKSASGEMLLLAPGGKVSLEVSGIEGVDEQAMEDALREAVTKAGWKVTSGSDIKVIATITRGEKQKLNYRPIGASFNSEGETVTLNPYRASLKIVRGDTTLWERSSQNMVPFLLHLKNGESIKEAVKRYEKADPDYFKLVTIPPKIFKPEHRKIVGSSRVQNGRWVDF